MWSALQVTPDPQKYCFNRSLRPDHFVLFFSKIPGTLVTELPPETSSWDSILLPEGSDILITHR